MMETQRVAKIQPTTSNMIKKPVQKPDIGKVVSIMGHNNFHKQVMKEVTSGMPVGEAQDLIARRKLKGMI